VEPIAKRLSLYSFATLVFALQGAIIATTLYAGMLMLLSHLPQNEYMESGFIFGTSAYVLFSSLFCAGLAFLISIIVRRLMGFAPSTHDGYWFCGLAVFLANAVAAAFAGIALSWLHGAIYATSLLSFWIGAKIYNANWRKIEAVESGTHH
jgi:hypothetical protein